MLAPLAERPFRLLWLGRVLSSAGDALVPVALAFAILSIDRSATALGVVLAAFSLSRVLFTLVGGVVGDRLSRRTVMLTCDGVRAAVEAFTGTMLLTGRMTLPLFVATGLLFGAASAFFGPASTALVPQTVPRERLQGANALLGLSQRSMLVFGPLLAGLLVATSGTGWVFVLDAVSFAASACCLARLQVGDPPRRPRAFVAELVEGFQEVRGRPWVVVVLVGFAIVNFGMAVFVVLGPLIVGRSDGSGPRGWGAVLAAGAVGGVLGGTLALRRRPRRPLVAVFAAGACVAAPELALVGPAPLALLAAAYALGLGATAYGGAVWEATLQERIPATALSRVSSYDWLVSLAIVPVGLAVTGPLAGWAGTRTVLVAAAATVVAACASLGWSLRSSSLRGSSVGTSRTRPRRGRDRVAERALPTVD